ncbi:hypothetical protein GCM10007920_43520 [Ciceribacter naphthalenivorans]|uniref:Uncharacterized protein n=3 Tax=Pseudomonadota TaxID=1224 RepID=A0A512HI33_9HYPH|nr:hypothetical protein RNA01_20400 [Ciceribacter naphthalenivorans]GLR24558.1 hypothetical protein GCM10007920_43520 [Ciceribacter naphthalenivorans]GLT07414.1 hypothetical protein GCM10007926_43520 [Sphingomonas psychrolutea]
MAGLLLACSALTGCVGSPTYGTDKTAMEQLVDDVGSAASIGSSPNKNSGMKYNPRPALVMPPETARTNLAAPQQSLAGKENPAWLESPEQARERLVAEADANADNPRYRSPLLAGYGTNGTMTESQKWQAFRDARKQQKGAYLDQRRYLSDPPTEYRKADEAALTDLGEPEATKEKRRKKMAKAAGQERHWWLPFQ